MVATLRQNMEGQLLVVIKRDGNDQYFHIVVVVVETKCKETWRWFLTLLLEDIGGMETNKCLFISNQQKYTIWLCYTLKCLTT